MRNTNVFLSTLVGLPGCSYEGGRWVHRKNGTWAVQEGIQHRTIHGHCHARACLLFELFDAETSELVCRQVPVYGTSNATFDETGCRFVPPCFVTTSLRTSSMSLQHPAYPACATLQLAPRRILRTRVCHAVRHGTTSEPGEIDAAMSLSWQLAMVPPVTTSDPEDDEAHFMLAHFRLPLSCLCPGPLLSILHAVRFHFVQTAQHVVLAFALGPHIIFASSQVKVHFITIQACCQPSVRSPA